MSEQEWNRRVAACRMIMSEARAISDQLGVKFDTAVQILIAVDCRWAEGHAERAATATEQIDCGG